MEKTGLPMSGDGARAAAEHLELRLGTCGRSLHRCRWSVCFIPVRSQYLQGKNAAEATRREVYTCCTPKGAVMAAGSCASLFEGCVIRTSVGIRRPSSAKNFEDIGCVSTFLSEDFHLQAKKAVQILGPLLAKCSS